MAEEEYPCEEQMFRSSDDVRQGFVTGIEAFTVKPVEYAVIDKHGHFRGRHCLGNRRRDGGRESGPGLGC